MMRTLILVFLALLTFSAEARDRKELYAFRRDNPCPSTHKPRGACHGYVVDHVMPLCGGGPDLRSNMQWQKHRAARAKDKREFAYCACLRHNSTACRFNATRDMP